MQQVQVQTSVTVQCYDNVADVGITLSRHWGIDVTSWWSFSMPSLYSHAVSRSLLVLYCEPDLRGQEMAGKWPSTNPAEHFQSELWHCIQPRLEALHLGCKLYRWIPQYLDVDTEMTPCVGSVKDMIRRTSSNHAALGKRIVLLNKINKSCISSVKPYQTLSSHGLTN